MQTRRDWIVGACLVGSLPYCRRRRQRIGRSFAVRRATEYPRRRDCYANGRPRDRSSCGPSPWRKGYAGAAIVGGRVYHHDYDEAKSEWSINCRSLADGKLVWQFREPREIRPNHAITRTIPAVDARFVFSLDPKAVLHCLDVKTGKQVWRKSLVTEYKATIPSWYNGQCPLQEPTRLIVATGGDAILVALDKATGKEIWRTPNPGQHVDVARFRDAGGARAASSSTSTERSKGRSASPRRTASCCGNSAASSTWRWRPRPSPSTTSASS